MEPPRARRCKADSEFAGVFRVGAGHESCRLFMPYLNESDLVRPLPKRLHDSVNAVSWQTEDHINSPIMNGINQNIGCRGFHRDFPPLALDLEGYGLSVGALEKCVCDKFTRLNS